ncbi:MAG: hypothetical protein ACOH10_07605 [Rhodoglobus sp.]
MSDNHASDPAVPEPAVPVESLPPRGGRFRLPSRRATIAVAAGTVALILAIAIPVGIAVQQSDAANARYDDALADRTDAATSLQSLVDDADELMGFAADYVVIADDTLAAAVDGYVGAEQKAALAASRDALAAAADAVSGFDTIVPTLGERPTGVSELDAATAELTTATPVLTSREDDLTPAVAELATQMHGTMTAGDALIATIRPSADALLAANYSAENLVHISYVSVVDSVEASLYWSGELAPEIANYVTAAQQLQASHASEEAQKAGPLYAQRVAVEAFARSIAGGVLLDFDWAPVVNGYGDGYGYGGYSTWNTAAPGYSTVSLSNSVAELWGVNPAVASLVAHEIGHSITSKCYDLFSTSFDSQDEIWATAWAIGMGYSEDGSGESIYSRPTNAQIALTMQGR